ncbi:glucose-6-phosphate isomerase [Clostridiaceae bacterium HSG29]|nr:glucose-6-phosphate isomerase [Clostridiaceae bacterium HSG29]
MKKITFDYSDGFVSGEEIEGLKGFTLEAHKMLHDKTGLGNDYVGWLSLPKDYDKEEFKRIKQAAEKIKNNSDILLVVGIGGSYLGSKAVIEALTNSFYNDLEDKDRKAPRIYFAGNNISGRYLKHLTELIKDKDFSVNVISKSGTTTETAIAFRVFKNMLEKKYGKDGAKERIFATTDKSRGALKTLADNEGYETFVIPDDVGGRFSVLTPVGLLPIAVSGLNIDELMNGAYDGMKEYSELDIEENPCYEYAIVRNALYNKGKTTEILVDYEPSLSFVGEWWKQLFGESEGKDGKGIFPAAVHFSTDLHSMGQYIQDGRRNIFETILNIEKFDDDTEILFDEEDLDGLNYIAGESFNFANQKAFEGTRMAHVDGNVPNLILNVPELNEYYFGKLIYFFEKACGISGYLLGVNPFNQPGVEAYKKNMFALLGKPGYEELREELLNRKK